MSQLKNWMGVLCLACLSLVGTTLSAQGQGLQRQIDSLSVVARQAASDSNRIWALTELTYLYLSVSLDSAIVYGEHAVNLASKRGSLLQQGAAHNDLASAYLRKGSLPEAEIHYRAAHQFRIAGGDTTAAVGSLTNLGTLFFQNGKYDSAMHLFVVALEHYERHGVTPKVNLLKDNISGVYLHMGQTAKAREYLEEIASYWQQTGDSMNLATTLGKLGSIEVNNQNYPAALQHYLRAANIFEMSKTASTQYCSMLYNIGTCHLYLNALQDAKRYYHTCQTCAQKIGDNTRLALADKGLGEASVRLGDYALAIDYFRMARPLLAATGERDHQLTILLGLSRSFAALGRVDSSNFYDATYSALQLELSEDRAVEAITELETKYQTSQKEAALAESRAARAEDQLVARRQTGWLLGSLAIALVAGAIGYLLYRQQRLKNSQLAQQAELELALARIEAQNELQDQRLRISRDLHDNIGAQLSFIISTVDAVKRRVPESAPQVEDRLDQLSDFAGGTVRELRDTVWAMNKEAVSIADLESRLAHFIQQARSAGEATEFRFEVSAAARELPPLKALAGMNTYRIVQEAINNAFKYAGGSLVEVTVVADAEGGIAIGIADDGRGFGESDEKSAFLRGGGNGLSSMRKRAEEIGADLTIDGRSGGTTIRLRVPSSALLAEQSRLRPIASPVVTNRLTSTQTFAPTA